MKQHNKTLQPQTSQIREKTTQEPPIEYFIQSQSFGFRFCYLDAQDPNYAENVVEELKSEED